MLPAHSNAITIARRVHALAVSIDVDDGNIRERYNELTESIAKDENVGCFIYLLCNVATIAIGVDGKAPASAVSYKIALEEANALIHRNACRA